MPAREYKNNKVDASQQEVVCVLPLTTSMMKCHNNFPFVLISVPPMIWIQNQLVGAAIGQKVTLECNSEAYPKSINYWMKNESIITPGELYLPLVLQVFYLAKHYFPLRNDLLCVIKFTTSITTLNLKLSLFTSPILLLSGLRYRFSKKSREFQYSLPNCNIAKQSEQVAHEMGTTLLVVNRLMTMMMVAIQKFTASC